MTSKGVVVLIDKYNKLTILKELKNKKNYGKCRTMVLCKCDCGNTVELPKTRVVNGYVKSCGCIKKEKQELVGKKFGIWTVLKEVDDSCDRRMFLCRCDCGNENVIPYTNLILGRSLSCGCKPKIYYEKYGEIENKKRLSIILNGMKERCYNPNHEAYKYYGAKGIKICDEWLNEDTGLIKFAEWSNNNGYKEDFTIDRINNNGDYTPENCRWVSNIEQAHNKSNNKMVTYNGTTKCLSEWAAELGVSRSTLNERLKRGWSVERTLTQPVRHRKK